MNILSRFTLKSMRQNPIRSLLTVLGVILSAAMFTAVVTMALSFWTLLVESHISTEGDFFISCDYLTPEEVSSLSEHPQIRKMGEYQALGYLPLQEDGDGPLSTLLLAGGDSNYFDMMPIKLTEGRLPQNNRELLLSEVLLPELKAYGYPTSLGSSISLPLLRQWDSYPTVHDLGAVAASFMGEYTVVGYMDADTNLGNGMDMYPMLTLAEGEMPPVLWSRAYVKCAPKAVWDLIQGAEFHDIEIKEAYLALYGQSKYQNFTTILLLLTAVLCLIIVVGSVSLIYNSFSISLGERTKQFGLLCCMGATKKQLRSAVYAEALFLALPGLPLGTACGYLGIRVTLWLLRHRLSLIIGDGMGDVTLRAVLSPAVLSIGALLALLTLLLSAALPAKRATSISPLEAIRQNRDYRLPKKIKAPRPSPFGFPATLAKSYYRISRGKYRSTLISLIVSLLLFLSAAGFTTGLRSTADQAINTQNYDFECPMPHSQGQELREKDFIGASAYVTTEYFLTHVQDEARSEEFLKYRDDIKEAYEQAVDPVADIQVFYLEDKILEEYLLSKNLDPKEYLDPKDPKALVCYKELITYAMADEQGIYRRYTYHYPPFSQSLDSLTLWYDYCPSGLEPFAPDEPWTYGYESGAKGELILSLIPLAYNDLGYIEEAPKEQWIKYELRQKQTGSTSNPVAFHLIDPLTGEAEPEPSCVEEMNLRRISLGETVKELPYGISQSAKDSPYYIGLILPLSVATKGYEDLGTLCFNAADYDKASEYMKTEYKDMHYIDYRQEEEAARAMILVVDIFSYGFIVLICLICIANIVNTLSTNVALRRRDFGMLRSIGMTQKDLNLMLMYECFSYGGKALLWGIPIGLFLNAHIQSIAADSGTLAYVFPLEAMIAAVISVLLIVFITIFYAASKLRKDKPIESIRQECL